MYLCLIEYKIRYLYTIIYIYSVLSATTGSFFAAEDAGTRPEMSVRPTLSIIKRIAWFTGSEAMFA